MSILKHAKTEVPVVFDEYKLSVESIHKKVTVPNEQSIKITLNKLDGIQFDEPKKRNKPLM